MADRVRVVMMGSPRTARAFRDQVEHQGLSIDDDAVPLMERRGGPATLEVIRYTFEVVGDGTILYQGVKLAVKKVRELFPGIDVEIEGDEEER